MPKREDYRLKRRRYSQISVKKRLEIVRLVESEDRSYSDVARKLHINASTVRLIIKKYNETGTIFMKKLRNAVKNAQELVFECQSEEVNIKKEEKVELDNTMLKIEQAIKENGTEVNGMAKVQENMQKKFPFYQQLKDNS